MESSKDICSGCGLDMEVINIYECPTCGMLEESYINHEYDDMQDWDTPSSSPTKELGEE